MPVAWLGSGSCQNRPSGWILMMMIKVHVCKVYNIAATLWLQFMVLLNLFIIINVVCFNISTFRSMFTVPKMGIMLSRYVVQVFSEWFWGVSWMILNLFHLPPYYWYYFRFYISSYFKIFSAPFLIIIMFPVSAAASVDRSVSSSLSRIMISGLMLGMFLSGFTFIFHNMVTSLP